MGVGPVRPEETRSAAGAPSRPILGVLDADGTFQRASSGLAELAGIEAEELEGQPIATLVDPASHPAWEQAWTEVVERGVAASCSVVLRRPDGQRRRVEAWVDVLGGHGGSTVVVMRDDEGLQHAAREARLLRRLTEAANDTSATTALFERALRDIASTMGWSPVAVRHPGDGGVGGVAADRAAASGRPVSDRTGDAWTVAVPVMADGEVAAVLVLSSDAAVELDAELSSLFVAVGQQLGSVVEREHVLEVLDQRTHELERSNSELERFAYVASHDLQEPLRKIVGFSELLEQRVGDQLADPGREYLGYVVDGARRMQRLIKDLLAYSRAGRATPSLQVVDLEQLVAEALDRLELAIDDAGATVTVHPLPAVWGDPDQLEAVLANLVSNAVKYHPGSAHVEIAGHQVAGAPEVEVTVTDDGIGIAPEYRDQVFEVFRRLHGPTDYPGTGIGLSITQRFVHAHGGRIWITGNEPTGTVFHVTLPAAPPPPEETP